jgi:hypothetical protein
LENDQSEKCQNMQTKRQIPTNPIHQKISIALVWNQLTGGQIDSPGWGGSLALASALCAGLMIGPQRRKLPAVTVISVRVAFEQHISGKMIARSFLPCVIYRDPKNHPRLVLGYAAWLSWSLGRDRRRG